MEDSVLCVQSFLHLLHTPRHERQSPRLVNRVDKLLLLGRRLIPWPLHFDCQKATGLRQTTNYVGNASGVGRDVAAIRFSNAGVLVLVAGDTLPPEIVQDLLLDVLFENGR